MGTQRVVGSIDFGTHGTGFGWTPISKDNEDPAQRRIFTCTQWPGQSVAYPKTMTAVLLDRDGAIIAWGDKARLKASERQTGGLTKGWRFIRSFKMSLGRDIGGDLFERPSVALDDSIDDVYRIIVGYLRKIYRFALDEISQSGYLEDEIRWCITVPAIWNDRQKQLMRRAAREAGLPAEDDRLLLALEPEAAAHHARVSGVKALGSVSNMGPSLAHPGARFMVVDCGGGTVDITAYRNDQQGRMIEIGRVSGDKRGSQYINEAFVECVLIKRLGGVEEFDRIQASCPADLEDLLDRWERVKLHAHIDQTDPLYLPLTAQLARRLGRSGTKRLKDLQDGIGDQIIITADEVRNIFDQVVPRILTLVDEQLAEMRHQAGPPEDKELVLLVGGFAASPYLQQCLRKHLGKRARVLIPPDPAVAVLSGAVHFAYAPHTRARRSRFTYGIDTCAEFEEGVDPESKKILLPDGEARCTDRFSVFVRAGDTIATGDTVTHEYTPLKGSQTGVDFDFYVTEEKSPRYIDSPGSHQIGHLSVDLTKVMHLDLERRGIRVAMRFGETEIKSTVTLIATGQQLDHTLDFYAD
jgi:actin-like ATPase involved in cell morphogenesis